MNPYLQAQRKKYEGIRESIRGMQQRAVDEDRDLTDDELRSIKEQNEHAKKLYDEIENLSEIEQRNAKVAELAATIPQPSEDMAGPLARDGGEQTRAARTGHAYTQDRDPGHYRQNGDHSFFADLYRSKSFHDEEARGRLHEHQRALSTGTEGAGVVPPNWLTNEFETLARQGRSLANAVRNIPLGDDPRPLTLPKQTAGTDSVVSEQSNENDTVDGTDAWDSDTDTVSPKPTAGKQIVSRQMIDMSNPAIDQLIYGDLVAVYNNKIERKVGKEILNAGSTLALNESDFGSTDGGGYDTTVDAAIEVLDARHMPADVVAMTVSRWGKYKKLKDSSGRPLIPMSTAGPRNVMGVGTIDAAGDIEGLAVIPTEGIEDDTTDQDTVAVLRAADTLLFESNMLRFRFEEQQGPESIVLGIWGYSAALVRQDPRSVRRIQIDEAA